MLLWICILIKDDYWNISNLEIFWSESCCFGRLRCLINTHRRCDEAISWKSENYLHDNIASPTPLTLSLQRRLEPSALKTSNHGHFSLCRTGESQYPVLIFRVFFLMSYLRKQVSTAFVPSPSVFARRALARRSNLIKVWASTSQSFGIYGRTNTTSYWRKPIPRFDFQVIFPYCHTLFFLLVPGLTGNPDWEFKGLTTKCTKTTKLRLVKWVIIGCPVRLARTGLLYLIRLEP